MRRVGVYLISIPVALASGAQFLAVVPQTDFSLRPLVANRWLAMWFVLSTEVRAIGTLRLEDGYYVGDGHSHRSVLVHPCNPTP